jgi:hypothetical protein
LINHYLFQTCHLLPDQVDFNLKLTNTIYDLDKISTTKNCTQVSNKDAENFITKQKP